jgi:hypothetical protein
MKLTAYERETVIVFNDEEGTAILDTASPVMQRRMDKLCSKSNDINCTSRGERYARYVFPKKCVSIRIPRQLTESQRAELASRASAMNRHHGDND